VGPRAILDAVVKRKIPSTLTISMKFWIKEMAKRLTPNHNCSQRLRIVYNRVLIFYTPPEANGYVASNGTNTDDVMFSAHIQPLVPLPGNKYFSMS